MILMIDSGASVVSQLDCDSLFGFDSGTPIVSQTNCDYYFLNLFYSMTNQQNKNKKEILLSWQNAAGRMEEDA